MKRRIVGTGGVVLVIALLGILAWYVIHTQATKAESRRAEARFQSLSQPVAVTFNVTVPVNTPPDQVLYISGSVPALGNWDAAGVPLQRNADGKYSASVPDLLNGMEYSFKVTRGTWGTVEATPDGKDVNNHTFTASKDATVQSQVANWIDGGKAVPGRVTMSGDIRLHKKFHSSILNNDRTLIVYVPPDYEKSPQQRYPVLYLQDGQNIFDESTSYQGIEWGVDEAAQRLIGSNRITPIIIVGVYNTEARNAEFTPPLAGVANAKGDAYAKMLSDEIKPFIDQRYRTQTDRAHTTIGGGSMGALVALYAAKTHNDVFGSVIALSPWLRIAPDKPIIKDLTADAGWLKNTKLFIDMGTDPGHNYPGGAANALPDAQAFIAQAGGPSDNLVYREIEGGKHNEASWNATIEQVLLAVYGKPGGESTSQPATRP